MSPGRGRRRSWSSAGPGTRPTPATSVRRLPSSGRGLCRSVWLMALHMAMASPDTPRQGPADHVPARSHHRHGAGASREELAATTVLDIGCNNGFFSLDMAHRGAQHVDGIDLRPENIAVGRVPREPLRARQCRVPSTRRRRASSTGRQWDVVLNLGVLYHVVNPLQFLEQTYALCRRFAIIDTLCHPEPVSAFMLLGNKDAASVSEGREAWEFQPTYRGAIDAIRYAGLLRRRGGARFRRRPARALRHR